MTPGTAASSLRRRIADLLNRRSATPSPTDPDRADASSHDADKGSSSLDQDTNHLASGGGLIGDATARLTAHRDSADTSRVDDTG